MHIDADAKWHRGTEFKVDKRQRFEILAFHRKRVTAPVTFAVSVGGRPLRAESVDSS